jgi:hypothetical protein
VGFDLGFLSRLVTERADKLLAALPLGEGRGSTLVVVGQTVCKQISAEAVALGELKDVPEAVARIHARTLLRLTAKLNLLHEVIATWGGDVARTDVPVGLLYLVDELISDLLPLGADPLLHLGAEYMYSTLAVLEAAQDLMKPEDFAHPHPVVFNVPGLSPVNAMLAPILAHEVGHTSWGQAVSSKLDAEIDKPAIEGVLRVAKAAGADPTSLIDGYQFWTQELMCDALAAVLCGPSFLFASAVFLPAPAEGGLGGHPYPRDRIRFTLRILDELEWTPVLAALVPEVLAWCTELAQTPELTGDPMETALRAAMVLIEPAMIKVAIKLAQNRVTSAEFLANKEELFDHLGLQIPPVYAGGKPAGPWLIILAGWLHELQQRHAEAIKCLPEIAGDSQLNRFLLKTIELSGVTSFWGGYDTPSA